ncbi:MAG TPA: winged helix DNA-binding domain-containing protein [Gemmatimonadaceae bacterium]|nr:winged helix DNA-binding domain-containing protein [Gemmatimonadaceae bacterium]
MTSSITTREIIRRRLAGQHLTAAGLPGVVDVVRSLGAVQAQDYAGAKWAIAQRARGVTEAVVEQLFNDGRILRTHVLRPTWHFVLPEDIRWMLALTGPRVNAAMASTDRRIGLDAVVFRRSHDAMAAALQGGACLTRAELQAAVERAGLPVVSGQRMGHLLMRAELDAVICSGPRRGSQLTYALFDDRVPLAPVLGHDEALFALTRRYFTTRGPASPHDFAWWSGLTVSDAKQGIDMARTELDSVTLDGRTLWFAPRELDRVPPSAHLLPNYDEYFIGYRDRSAAGARVGHTRPISGGDARVPHVVFVDGQIVGEWRRVIDNDTVVVELVTSTPLSAAEATRVRRAARTLASFLERPLRLQWRRSARATRSRPRQPLTRRRAD